MQNRKVMLWFLILMSFCIAPLNGYNEVDIGVVLDLDTTFGKILRTSISMALQDFYNTSTHTTMIVPHFRDSKSDVVTATSSAIDLLKNTQVVAIFGPHRSIQADFVIDIGNTIRVPIISPATSPALSPQELPYFIRSSWSSSSQAKAIAAVLRAFRWREVNLIYEDSKYGCGILPLFSEPGRMEVTHQTVFSPHAGKDEILQELFKLKTKQTRVFVVHMGTKLASSFFKLVKEAEMMRKGYVWIIADSLTSLLGSVDTETMEAMQGVVGVKAYIPKSNKLSSFRRRWSNRFHAENPDIDIDIDRTEVNSYGLWAYDAITALSEAVERVGVASPRFNKSGSGSLTDLEAIGTSNIGESLAGLMRNYSSSQGLSGNFTISNGELQASAFEIVNVIGNDRQELRVGFWTERHGLSRELKGNGDGYSTNKENLGVIFWPGLLTNEVPKGWDIPTSGQKLRVGVPVKGGFSEFITVDRNPDTNAVEPSGFSIDVFEEVMKMMPYAVLYEYIESNSTGDYDDLVKKIHQGEYDAVVGDVTVTANRSEYADFTVPYTESGVATIVPIKDTERKNAWIFMKPMTTALWLTIGAFFVFIGFVVWVLEHPINEEFQGPPLQQLGMLFWFSFSTLVFAHREKVMSNLTRFVMIVWLFVVLVLTQSYTASLTSMLTVQQLQPTIAEIRDLLRTGEYVGYQHASFVSGFLNTMDFDKSRFRNYSTAEYDEALSKGSTAGGVAAIVDEVPYIKLFLNKNCHKYTMIGPTYKTSGFGFAFPKGSPLVPDVSRAILKLKENAKMVDISRKWLGDDHVKCQSGEGSGMSSDRLSVDTFKGLFVIAGVSSSSALALFLFKFLYHHRYILTSTATLNQKIYGLARLFCGETNANANGGSSNSKHTSAHQVEVGGTSPAISIPCDHQDMFSQDEGFAIVQPSAHPVPSSIHSMPH